MTQDEFIAVVSHELRGVIGAIGAAAQVLEAEHGSAVAEEARGVIARQSQRLALALDDVRHLGRLMGPLAGSRAEPVDLIALLRGCEVQVRAECAQLMIATDGAQLQDALERTVREAPSRPWGRIEPEEKEAATLFTLEPVGGGFGVQFLRALLERAGAQVSLLQGPEGRRVAARLPL